MDTIIVLDFGSQYTQLIARRIRELNIYCEIHPYNKIPELTQEVKGVVFSGGSVQQSKTREYGRANLQYVDYGNPLMKDVPLGSQVWMSHGDTIERLPEGYRVICSTDSKCLLR